jgi:hypothetical protein
MAACRQMLLATANIILRRSLASRTRLRTNPDPFHRYDTSTVPTPPIHFILTSPVLTINTILAVRPHLHAQIPAKRTRLERPDDGHQFGAVVRLQAAGEAFGGVSARDEVSVLGGRCGRKERGLSSIAGDGTPTLIVRQTMAVLALGAAVG